MQVKWKSLHFTDWLSPWKHNVFFMKFDTNWLEINQVCCYLSDVACLGLLLLMEYCNNTIYHFALHILWFYKSTFIFVIESICIISARWDVFLTSYAVCFFFIFKGLRREMIVRFVNIEGIVDHHCLIYHFIINTLVVYWLIISRILRKWKRRYLI